MGVFDPLECQQAEHHLQHENVLAAVEILLGARQTEHRAVQSLLMRCQEKLVVEASLALDQGKLDAAGELLDAARRCGPLPVGALELPQRLESQRITALRDQAEKARRMQEARRLTTQGNLNSALELVESLPPDAAQASFKEEILRQQARVARRIESCQQQLAQGRTSVARRLLEYARAIAPQNIEVIEMDLKLNGPGSSPQKKRTAINDRRSVFCLPLIALVTPAPSISLGLLNRDPKPVPGEVDPPFKISFPGLFHRRNLDLRRTVHGYEACRPPSPEGGLVGFTSKINGQPLINRCLLKDGDQIELADDKGGRPTRFCFEQSVAGNLTAVIRSEQATAIVNNHNFQTIVLLDRLLMIRPKTPAHLVWPDLPFAELRFEWTSPGLRVITSADGCVFTEPECDADEEEGELPVPLTAPRMLVAYAPQFEEMFKVQPVRFRVEGPFQK